MTKSTALSTAVNPHKLALTQEAEAHKHLTTIGSSMVGYKDANGKGPGADSLKGIMITTSRRIALRYGRTVPDMPMPMLRHVQQLKYDMGDLLRGLMDKGAEYTEIKSSLWALIDYYSEEYQKRQSRGMY